MQGQPIVTLLQLAPLTWLALDNMADWLHVIASSNNRREFARVLARERAAAHPDGERVKRQMEGPHKTESRKGTKASERKPSENDSEEELQPPSPIQIAPEGALVPDFDFPDPKELRRIESDTQNRLKAILEVAGVTGLSQIDARTFQDPEILRKLTNRFVDCPYTRVVTWLSYDGYPLETQFPWVSMWWGKAASVLHGVWSYWAARWPAIVEKSAAKQLYNLQNLVIFQA